MQVTQEATSKIFGLKIIRFLYSIKFDKNVFLFQLF